MEKECKYCCKGDNEYLFDSEIPMGILNPCSVFGFVDINKKKFVHGLYISDNNNEFAVKINYCPMCGRKL